MNFDIARLAAQLARTSAARHMTVDEIAADAIRITAAGRRARQELEAGRAYATVVERIKPRLAEYGAIVLDNGDLAGMVLGLKFDDGSYRNGARNVFHLV